MEKLVEYLSSPLQAFLLVSISAFTICVAIQSGRRGCWAPFQGAGIVGQVPLTYLGRAGCLSVYFEGYW